MRGAPLRRSVDAAPEVRSMATHLLSGLPLAQKLFCPVAWKGLLSTTRIARPLTAMPRHARTRWPHSPRAGGGSETQGNEPHDWRVTRTWRLNFCHGQPLEPEELEMIRQQIESGFDDITQIDPEIRGIVERNWPHLLAKLPPDQ
jgi:hypothetical protein